MKRLKNTRNNYGTLDKQTSLPNIRDEQAYSYIESDDNIDSDVELDPVANNYIISDQPARDESNGSMNENESVHGTLGNSYVIEPVAFIQNLASSTMTISVGQFIYNRIYTRLVDEAHKKHRNKDIYNTSDFNFLNSPVTRKHSAMCIENTTNRSLINMTDSFGEYRGDFLYNLLPMKTTHDQATTHSVLYNFYKHDTFRIMSSMNLTLTPDELNEIRNKAQEQTAHLYFLCALYAAIPIILMTNILGVNCSCLGRKTLIVINLLTLTIRYLLYLLQCIFEDWPDWVFFIGSLIESVSGANGIFYLALYCFIADLSPAYERSYRITLINNLNSIASICVTGISGYVIKYYGYFYIFMTSWCLIVIALVYTIFYIPEPLAELKNISMWTRFKSISILKSANCLKVYFEDHKYRNKSVSEEIDEDEEVDSLLRDNSKSKTGVAVLVKKQTGVLLLVVFTNFIYVFGTMGIQSIFTLFIMNAPYCFDSVQISQFSIFTTVVSLVMCLLVSKFIRANDILICAFSCTSFFASVFCYIYGNSTPYLYLGSVVASIGQLQYGYARSIVSKSMAKDEVSDALSLIMIVDTIIALLSLIIFPVFYSSFVAQGINILFIFSNGFVLLAIILNIVNFFFYKPINVERSKFTAIAQGDRDMTGIDDENDPNMIIESMIHSVMIRSIETI